MSESYILLKPESAIYIDFILDYLASEEYSIGNKCVIEDYKRFAEGLYYIGNYIKDPKYYEIIKACIEVEIRLFGNLALLIQTKNEESLLHHLIHLDRIKSEIRKRISLSKSKCLQAFVDVDKLGVECSCATSGEIKIISTDNEEPIEIQPMYKFNAEPGRFVSFYLSYLHSLDTDIDIYKKSLEYISNFSQKTSINELEFKRIRKYQSFCAHKQ